MPADGPEFLWRVEDVPDLGANDAHHQRDRHHPHRIRGHPRPLERAVNDDRGRHSGHPQHQPESGQVERSNMQIRKHLSLSIDVRRSYFAALAHWPR